MNLYKLKDSDETFSVTGSTNTQRIRVWHCHGLCNIIADCVNQMHMCS